MKLLTILAVALLAACGSSKKSTNTVTTEAAAVAACPANISEAVTKAYPDAVQSGCEAETEDGKQTYEVSLVKADGAKVEVDVAADGTIIKEEPDND